MNLLTGIARVAVVERRKPRLTRIDEEIELAFRVSPFDLDYNLHMNNARYFVAMEIARLALVVRSGLFGLAVCNRWVFSNAAQKAVFFPALRVFERYNVSARVLYMDDEWLYLKQHVRQGRELVATGLFKLRVKEGRETRSPREITAKLGYSVLDIEVPREVVEWEKVNALLLEERRAEAGWSGG